MNRSQRQLLAAETVTIYRTGGYTSPTGKAIDLTDDFEAAVAGTQLYRPGQLEKLAASISRGSRETAVDVTDETTLAAARRLADGSRTVATLNFASAKNPGGGFLSGAGAQEESIARASGLVPCLEAAPDYYAKNRAFENCLYTDHLIYSPDVPIFRDDDGGLLDEPFFVSILTAPAPNAGAVRSNTPHLEDEIEPTLARRIRHVLAVAADQRHDAIVLGAWGCGVFKNDPAAVAELFKNELNNDFAGVFERVAFAIYDPTKGQATLAAFRETF